MGVWDQNIRNKFKLGSGLIEFEVEQCEKRIQKRKKGGIKI